MSDTEPLITVREAAFGYGRKAVVRVGAFELRGGESVGVYGPNGAGKTTLLRGLTKLLPPMSGRVDSGAKLTAAYLPQHRAIDPHWPMTALDVAALQLSARRRFGWTFGLTGVLRDAMGVLEVADLERRPFAALSGGQQQRVMIAGVLAAKPALIVLDEPTDGLDARSREIVTRALRGAAAAGACLVVVSHLAEELRRLCTSVAFVRPGAEPGQPSEVSVTGATAFDASTCRSQLEFAG